MPKEIDLKNADVIRKAYASMGQSLAAAIDLLEEPWKTQFASVKTGLDQELASLPPTDQIPAAMAANNCLQTLFTSFCNVGSLFAGFNQQLASMKASVATPAATAASLATAVDAEIARRIADGKLFDAAGVDGKVAEARKEFMPKTEVQSLCSVAKEQGITEGRQLQRTEMEAAAAAAKVIDGRKLALSTASIPLPLTDVEKLLAGTDEEFTARKVTAETRLGELKDLGVSNCTAPVFGKVWADEPAYNEFRETVKAFASPLEKPDPLVTNPPAAAGRPALPAMLA